MATSAPITRQRRQGGQPLGPCFLKLLVTNTVAGSIIGQKGATVAKISTDTGATVRLSNSMGYFPGTLERVVLLAGAQEEVAAAFKIILEHIRDSLSSNVQHNQVGVSASIPRESGQENSESMVVKIVVPNSAVSGLIGRQGQSIKKLQETAGCRIQVSNRDESNIRERVAMVSGAYDKVVLAASEIFEQIQNDPHLKDHTEINYTGSASLNQMPYSVGMNGYFPMSPQMGGGGGDGYHHPHHQMGGGMNDYMMGGGGMNGMQGGGGSSFGYQPGGGPNYGPGVQASAQSCGFYVEIPDAFAGALIGKSGSSLLDIQRRTGARVVMSAKGVFVPGTENRRANITGSMNAVHQAHFLLVQRLQEIQNVAGNSSRFGSGGRQGGGGIDSDVGMGQGRAVVGQY